MLKVLSILIGGAIGALLRYLIVSIPAIKYPWGTFLVNIIGCFAIGILFALFEKYNEMQYLKSFIFIGFLGAFTTFSTFSLDILNLFKDGKPLNAVLYLSASNISGIALVFIGYYGIKYLQQAS